ncbi:MAG: 3-ketosteroid-delta-1-dehydrogenase [Lysinibacillus sp.]
MILTKQQALQALNKKKFIGFTITNGNIILKKKNKTDYDIFVFEDGNDTPIHYVGSIMNIMATMSDKSSNKDYIIVDSLPSQDQEASSEIAATVVDEVKEPISPALEEVTPAKIKVVSIDEETRSIEGFEGLYEITLSGRVITVREQRALARCQDEYGFHTVRLTKDGVTTSLNVFKLWENAFPEQEHTTFKGALKAKYGTGCKLIDKPGIHF